VAAWVAAAVGVPAEPGAAQALSNMDRQSSPEALKLPFFIAESLTFGKWN
jgi:hypothetical protein